MAEKELSLKNRKTSKKSAETSKIRELFAYFHDARLELRKVSWPKRRETLITGLAVFIVVVIISLFLGIVDFGISALIRYLLSL